MVKVVGVPAIKGGVGKTLIAINIAHRLNEMGYRVGLIDADIDNSCFAEFTKKRDRIEVTSEHKFKPYDWNGIQVFSMSLLVDPEKSVSMTADRYSQILDDAVRSGVWDVEYFIVDLPSGAHDLFKSSMIIFAKDLVGNIIVTQPSMVIAARRALNLHQYFEIPVLGVIENMSYFKVGKAIYYPFGKSRVDEIAKEYGVEVLGKIPLSSKICEGVENGDPIFKGDLAEPIINACNKIVKSEVQRVGLLEKLKAKITDALRIETKKVLLRLIILANRKFDIPKWTRESGFVEQRPFDLVITDEREETTIARIHLRIRGGVLKILKKPKKVDFEAAMSYRTFARMIMGVRKLSDGSEIPYDAEEAWLNNDFKVYGLAHTPRVIKLFRDVFSSEEVMSSVREQYGDLLGRWI